MIAQQLIAGEVVFEIGSNSVAVRNLEVVSLEAAFDQYFPVTTIPVPICCCDAHIGETQGFSLGCNGVDVSSWVLAKLVAASLAPSKHRTIVNKRKEPIGYSLENMMSLEDYST
mgnify:CR=1 FL=1